MTQKATPPKIEFLKFKELEIDNIYSGRTEKEINENAKEKQKELAAAGGWSPAMPGQYFIGENGKKYLSAGFSRVKASQLNGEDGGYFVEVPNNRTSLLLACITTNSTRSLTALQQGSRFSELSQGVLSDDFSEAIADPKNPEHWKHQPMSNADIAEIIGKSSEWVRKCIAIFEAPPEIRDMLEAEKIAVTVVEGAKSLVDKHFDGSEAKQIKICQRAFTFARNEGKDTATKQHFDAIKAEFIPVKKLVADGNKEKEEPEKPDGNKEKENLFRSTPPDDAPPAVSKKAVADCKKIIADILSECSDDYTWAATDADIDGAVEKILAAIDVF